MKKVTSIDLVNQCFKNCSWTILESLLLNSASAYASSVINKFLNSFTAGGIHLQLRNPEQLAIFACCGIRNKINGPKKKYFTSICTLNPRKYCNWNPLTIWNMFKYLCLEPRNIQTQNFAPIQCTVWPRNCIRYLVICYCILNPVNIYCFDTVYTALSCIPALMI